MSLLEPSIEPNFSEVTTALQKTAQDLMPFAQICVKDSLLAENIVLDNLLLALENSWINFALSKGEEFTHLEFREEIFRTLWLEVISQAAKGPQGKNSILGESNMRFYKLVLQERAVLFLRMRAKFTFDAIQRILGLDSAQAVESILESAREKILGRSLLDFDTGDSGVENA